MDKKYSIGSFRNVLILKRKKKEMVDFEICNKSVIKSNSLMLHLDEELYDLNKNEIEKEKMKGERTYITLSRTVRVKK